MTSFVLKLARDLKKLAGFGPPAKPSCKVCGRPLYSKGSIERGMGAVCAGRHLKRDTRTIDMLEAGTPGSEAV
jgi:hypothetical protein